MLSEMAIMTLKMSEKPTSIQTLINYLFYTLFILTSLKQTIASSSNFLKDAW